MPHDRTGIKLPKASEELVETLEDNQVLFFSLVFSCLESEGNI